MYSRYLGQNVELRNQKAWLITMGVLQTLREGVEEDGAEFLIVVIPSKMIVHAEDAESLKKTFNIYIEEQDWEFSNTYRRFLRELKDAGFNYVDPTHILLKVRNKGGVCTFIMINI